MLRDGPSQFNDTCMVFTSADSAVLVCVRSPQGRLVECGFSRKSRDAMSLHNVTPGAKAPDEFNVIIEIPMNADPIKYEVDKETGAMFVDRFMTTAMHYPCNYGYVPKTLSDDGDPVDVLVVTPFALTPGVVVTCRAIGVLMMEDEAGRRAPPPAGCP